MNGRTKVAFPRVTHETIAEAMQIAKCEMQKRQRQFFIEQPDFCQAILASFPLAESEPILTGASAFWETLKAQMEKGD